jgi:hypothetical protein
LVSFPQESDATDSDAVVNLQDNPNTIDESQLDSNDLKSTPLQELESVKKALSQKDAELESFTKAYAIHSGNYCATMQDMDVKFASFDIPDKTMRKLQDSLSRRGLLFHFLPSEEQMKHCEVLKDPPRTSIGRTIPCDFKGKPRYLQGLKGHVQSLATIMPANHIHPYGKSCRLHFGTYSLIPFRLKLDRKLSEKQIRRIVDSRLLGIRPKSKSNSDTARPRTQNAGFFHSYANIFCIENQGSWMDEYASLSFIPCFESELEYWNYKGGPIKLIVLGATPAVLCSISATDPSMFETLSHDDPAVKIAFLTAEKVVAQITQIMLSQPDSKRLPNRKLCRDYRAWLRQEKEVPVLTPSPTNTKPFMVVQLGRTLLPKPGKNYPPYYTVVQPGKRHGVDPISLLCRSINGWTNTKFFAGQLRGFTLGSKHVHRKNPAGCNFVPGCSDEEGDT